MAYKNFLGYIKKYSSFSIILPQVATLRNAAGGGRRRRWRTLRCQQRLTAQKVARAEYIDSSIKGF